MRPATCISSRTVEHLEPFRRTVDFQVWRIRRTRLRCSHDPRAPSALGRTRTGTAACGGGRGWCRAGRLAAMFRAEYDVGAGGVRVERLSSAGPVAWATVDRKPSVPTVGAERV